MNRDVLQQAVEARKIAAQLREVCAVLRRRPIPLDHMIPVMQEAADVIDALETTLQKTDSPAEIDRDTDGELLIDWSPGPGRMVTLSLRDDGRLSYAFTWDAERSHGTAQMPTLQKQPEPVAWRYRYSPKQDWKLTSQPTTQWAADHSRFEEEPLYASPSTTQEKS